MTTIFARQALLPEGWAADVRIDLAEGRIASVDAKAAAAPGDERHDTVIAGMPNLHSHAFQRGMAGLAEVRGSPADSFWSWRDLMYRFALTMTPEQAEAIAAQLYVEMLEAGFTRVGEFHYLHHDRDGQPYGNLTEMADRIIAAAKGTGIGLTLLPVFYAHSNFAGAAPADEQRRFINDLDGFVRLLDQCRQSVRVLDRPVVGVAPHSLRAVTPHELHELVRLAREAPIHIHVAEQVKEVEDCLAWSGRRPVEWLLANAEVDGRWCLIHATHMTRQEAATMAQSGAVAGLCPVTEANLGDGIFAASVFREHGGRFGIGSDSNILIGVADELRQLEYSQRLAHRARNVVAEPGRSTGRTLFDAAVAGGAQALGASTGTIEAGAPADLVSLDLGDTGLEEARGDTVLDAWIFSGRARVDCVWTAGWRRVSQGRHAEREPIAGRFRKAMRELTA